MGNLGVGQLLDISLVTVTRANIKMCHRPRAVGRKEGEEEKYKDVLRVPHAIAQKFGHNILEA